MRQLSKSTICGECSNTLTLLAFKRAYTAFLGGNFTQARELYSIPGIAADKESQAKQRRGLLLCDTTEYLENQGTQTPDTNNSALCNIVANCLEIAKSDTECGTLLLMHIICFLLDTWQWNAIQSLKLANTSSNVEVVQIYDLASTIAELMAVAVTASEKEKEKDISSIVVLMTRILPVMILPSGAFPAILEHITSIYVLHVLLAVLFGALHSVQKTTQPSLGQTGSTANKPEIERWGLLAEGGAAIPLGSLPTKVVLVDILHAILDRLGTLLHRSEQTAINEAFPCMPSPCTWMIGMGDVLYERGKFRDAVKYYLMCIALESTWFVSPVPARRTAGAHLSTINKLVQALINIKATAQAVALLQLLVTSNNGYVTAARLLQDDAAVLNHKYFEFVWDISFLELLVHTFSRRKEEKVVFLLTKMLGVPELNEFNAPEVRAAFVQQMKINLLKVLCQDFLIT
jgi:hypothetical protein